MEERIQKIMARAGVASRRASEKLIEQGLVTVNGQRATLGMKADPDKDLIEVKGERISAKERLVYIALNKPRGVISAAKSPDPRPTVLDLVDHVGRLYPVGRLDIESEGLILLTNDGAMAQHLTHPRYGHEKEYTVLVAQRPDDKQLTAWRNGVVLEDGYRTKPVKVWITGTKGKGAWLKVILKEGRKRQIREMGKLTGLPIVKITRTRIASLRLGNLKPRQWRHLTPDEISELKK
ncbi:MAG: rRNA pseudouridine synthase [Anaerolineales bacterium]|nr:rRNA pseudouridine synthase [Chloroflexota bacterium]MBL6980185.1 rRNA pseudouridine synthase [Anaerolineales bacterium]